MQCTESGRNGGVKWEPTSEQVAGVRVRVISHLALSHRSWGTAQCEEQQCLHNKQHHGPTSKASPRTES